MSPTPIKPHFALSALTWVLGIIFVALAVFAIADEINAVLIHTKTLTSLSLGQAALMLKVFYGMLLSYAGTMVLMPVWSGLVASAAARQGVKLPKYWSWLGYLVPLVCYWQPARTLWPLADTRQGKASIVRCLIVAWAIARNLASISGFYAFYLFLGAAHVTGLAHGTYLAHYILITVTAACSLSAIIVVGTYRYLLTQSAAERHAEVFI